MKPGKFGKAAILAAFLFVVPLAGCTTADRTGQRPNNNIGGRMINDTNPRGMGTGIYDKNTRVPGATPGPDLMKARTPYNNLNGRVRADNIRNGLSGMKDLGKVNVLTSGDDAIIGYAPGRTKAARDMKSMRDKIVKRVRQIDPDIRNIYISDTKNISDQIEKLYNKVIPNNAGDRLNNDVQQLMRKIPFVAR